MQARVLHTRMRRSALWGTIALAPLLLLSGVHGCEDTSRLDHILASNTLTVVTRNSPTTYFESSTGPTGFEYALARQFADYLGVELKVRETQSLEQLFQVLDQQGADIAAAGLNTTPDRTQRYDFTSPYFKADPIIVYEEGLHRPHAVEDVLNQDIQVLSHSSHAELLGKLARKHPQLRWRESSKLSTLDLLKRVEQGKLRYTVVNSHEFAILKAYYPRVRRSFALSAPGTIAWALPRGPDNAGLRQKVDEFFSSIQRDGSLGRLKERFYGHTSHAGQGDSRTFTRNYQRRFPQYSEMIKSVARSEELDWRLLAAISYRESHWNPDAISPTGVRGMMMLTRTTAAEMGVEDRVDTEQSLRGGARYFKKIWRRLPPDIHEPDKTWLALAAYNLGMSHLNDARILTERQGADPHHWPDVMKRLPLLEEKSHYQTLHSGYARGREAVTYVQHIRHYYHLMRWLELESPGKQAPPLEVHKRSPENLRSGSSLTTL